jgi:hypothetical protein
MPHVEWIISVDLKRDTWPHTSSKEIAMARKYSLGASKSVERAMKKRKRGTLKSGREGRGGKVTSREQAIAIGLSEARKKGAKVPKKAKQRESP